MIEKEKKNLTLVKANHNHVKEAVTLALMEYEKECGACSQLIKQDYHLQLNNVIQELFSGAYSYVALEDDKVIGFLGFFGPIEGSHGNCKGAFCPLGGSGFLSNDRSKLASKLLGFGMQSMIRDGITTFALSRYAHDEEVSNGLILNGFGIRCSDAIMDLNNPKDLSLFDMIEEESQITYMELEKQEFTKLNELHNELILHLCHAPILFPTSIECLDHFEESLNNRVFVAKEKEEIIGFIEVTREEGETFLTLDESMYNICGACVRQQYRDGAIAKNILSLLVQTLKEEGITTLGVDCETLNPTALRFWGKYFDAYTYSYERRIDERVIGYEEWFLDHIEKKKEI